jgi:ABC-type antimicrobial peptide transport system permease subunit
MTFDKSLEHDGRLFQVMEHRDVNGSIQTTENTNGFLGHALASEFPEIERVVVTTPENFFPPFTLSATGEVIKRTGKFADKDFFRVFSFDLLYGNIDQILSDKSSVVISESLAKTMFASAENSMGQTMRWETMNIRKEVSVSGVFKDVPHNSSQQFDFVLPFDAFRDIMGMNSQQMDWDNSEPFRTYFIVHDGVDEAALDLKLRKILSSKSSTPTDRQLSLRRYSDQYLYGDYENGKASGGRIQYVILISIVAAFVLLIACINFINLSTAKAMVKGKETGIKKAIGAQRKTLIAQFMTESTLITGIAVLLSIALTALLLPEFNAITGKRLLLVFDIRTSVVLLALTVITSALAGGYPSFYLSGFNPAKTIRGQLTTSRGENASRKALTVFQFGFSIVFIAAVIITHEQLEFIQSRNLGFNKENIIYFDAEGKVPQNLQIFLSEIRKIDGVNAASSMLGNIIWGDGEELPVSIGGKTLTLHHRAVNYGLLELLNLEVIAGRSFSPDFPTDIDKVICNEAALSALEIEDPVGKTIGGKEILGVVRDFHFQSFRRQIKPMIIRLEPPAVTTIMVKIQAGSELRTIGKIQEFYARYNTEFMLDYHFLDENFEAQYMGEKRVSMLAKYTAVLAIVISCLGLFGLTSFSLERRGKEISIRKILGSTVFNILFLLSTEYIRIVFFSVLIALPVSFFLATQWLDGFAYRIDLKAWYFIAAPVLILAMGAATIVMQSIKAATANPVTRLKSE